MVVVNHHHCSAPYSDAFLHPPDAVPQKSDCAPHTSHSSAAAAHALCAAESDVPAELPGFDVAAQPDNVTALAWLPDVDVPAQLPGFDVVAQPGNVSALA
jgi:hypothetical protein